LSQCTRVTDGQTDGQNYDSQDALAYAPAVEMGNSTPCKIVTQKVSVPEDAHVITSRR